MITPVKLVTAIRNRIELKAARGPIGIGLVGVGGWGATNAANIMRSRRFTVRGALDADRQCGLNFARRFGTTCYANLDQLLSDTTVDAVCITVPNHLHLEHVTACATAGKHVFVEKPLASLAEDCDVAGRVCEEKQVVLQVGHQMRLEPVFLELKRLVERGTLGTPLYAQGVYALERRQRGDWRMVNDLCPGGSMEQLGIHLLDVLVHLFGPPATIRGTVRAGEQTSEWRWVELGFADGATATVSTSFSSPAHLGLELFFEGGRVFTDGISLWTKEKSGKVRHSRPRGTAGGVLQFTRFADAIEGGTKPETGAAEARILMDIIQSVHGGGSRV